MDQPALQREFSYVRYPADGSDSSSEFEEMKRERETVKDTEVEGRRKAESSGMVLGQVAEGAETGVKEGKKVREGKGGECRDPVDQKVRRIIKNFTPSFFIINMSTGVIAILLHQLPYNAHWLGILATIFFVLNVFLFVLFTLMSALRYTLYPSLWKPMVSHPHQSLFMGAFPIGLSTVIIMLVLVCVPAWGQGWAIFAWVLWWINGVVSLAVAFHMAWVIMTNHRPALAEMTSLWLIPIVSIVAVSSTGSLVASELHNVHYKIWTIVISYVYWGIGMPFAYMVLTVYFLRLTVHKPLPREVIVSAVLPVGPLGIGAFSILSLSKNAVKILPATHSLPLVANAGSILYVVSFLIALLMWGFAILWFVVAMIMIITMRRFPFNLGWWGSVFPIGIFTLTTISIGNELNSKFFKMLGEVLSFILTLLWLVLAVRTIIYAHTGEMFLAPCLGRDLKGHGSSLKEGKAGNGKAVENEQKVHNEEDVEKGVVRH